MKREKIRVIPCRGCGKYFRREHLSWQSLCVDCSLERMKRNVVALRLKKGPEWEKWKIGMSKFLEKVSE